MNTLFNAFFITLFSLTLLTPLAGAETYEFKFNHQDRTQDQPEHKPKVVNAGTLSINGVPVSAYNATFENPREMGVLAFRAKALNAKIKAEHLKQLELFGMPNGNVFVPQHWQLIYGGISKNGSLSYTFLPTTGSNGYLTFYHTSGCLSCAMTQASLFFSQAVKDAKAHDFNYYTSTNLPLSVVQVKPNLVAYSVEQNDNRIDGLAYYNPHAELPFWKAEISLPKDQAHLINPLLNQFIAKYN